MTAESPHPQCNREAPTQPATTPPATAMPAPPADRNRVSTLPASPGPQPDGPSASDASLRQVVDGMHEGVVVRDASGVIVYVNAAAERILRRTRESWWAASRSTRAACAPTARRSCPSESVSSIALATGRDAVEELVGLQVDDGELRWFSVNARVLREGDVVTGVLSTFVDVTEHRNMVAALAESERRFRLLAENAGDLITSIDPNGIRTYVSPSCRALLGYEPEELIGRVAVEIVHPDDRARVGGYLEADARARPGVGRRRASCTRTAARSGSRRAAAPCATSTATWSSCRSWRATSPSDAQGGGDAARERERGRRRARRAPHRARRDDAVRDHRHRRRRPDHRLQRRRRAHARLPRRGRSSGATAPICSTIARSSSASRSSSACRSSACSGTARATRTRTRATGRSSAATARSCRCRSRSRRSATPTARSPATSASGATSPAERQAARELRDAEERFRNAFDQAPIGKALVSTEGVFIRVNDALCRITGYAEAELLGDDVPGADAPRRPRRRPRRTCDRLLAGRERVVLDGEALPARRRALHLGAAERLARARRGRRAALLRLADPGHQRAEADGASGSRS